jgi:ABC-2 type transport system permease protein
MIMTMFIFILLGQVLGSAMNDATESATSGKVSIADLDGSAFTADIIKNMEADGYVLNIVKLPENITPAAYPDELSKLDIKSLIIIPAGFGDTVMNKGENGELTVVTEMSVGGVFTNLGSLGAVDAVNAINAAAKDEVLLKSYNVSEDVIRKLDAGAATVSYTTLNGKIAKIGASALSMVMMFQMMVAPIVVFFLLTMSSQMIMTAISTEKIDKTLETLLSTPVSRIAVLMSKMTAAVVAALLNTITMGIGMVFYVGGMMGGVAQGVMNSSEVTGALEQQSTSFDINAATDAIMSVPQALATLGVTMSLPDYLLLGLQLILSLAIGLTAALILGAMATDAKSQASLMLPITMATMLPFFITLFVNVNDMPIMLKFVMYAIPFTHSYMAAPNLMSGDYLLFWCGVLYQAVFLAAALFAAVRMFMSDKLFTTSIGETQNKKSLFAKKYTLF